MWVNIVVQIIEAVLPLFAHKLANPEAGLSAEEDSHMKKLEQALAILKA